MRLAWPCIEYDCVAIDEPGLVRDSQLQLIRTCKVGNEVREWRSRVFDYRKTRDGCRKYRPRIGEPVALGIRRSRPVETHNSEACKLDIGSGIRDRGGVGCGSYENHDRIVIGHASIGDSESDQILTGNVGSDFIASAALALQRSHRSRRLAQQDPLRLKRVAVGIGGSFWIEGHCRANCCGTVWTGVSPWRRALGR